MSKVTPPWASLFIAVWAVGLVLIRASWLGAQALRQPDPLAVVPPQQRQWVTPAVTAPRVQQKTFESKAAKAKVSYHIYTPEVYDLEEKRRFPVLYWLHGYGGGLSGVAPISAFFDRAIREKKIPPMLIVFPNGLPYSMWCDSKDGTMPVETVVVKELIPHVDAHFRTIASREGRLIEGFSMGGAGAARMGFKYSALFGAISLLGAGPLDLEFKGPRATQRPEEREHVLRTVFGGDLEYYTAQSPWTWAQRYAVSGRNKVRIRQIVGDRDPSLELNRQFSEHLQQFNIPHVFTVLPGVGHNAMAVLNAFGESEWTFYRAAFGDEGQRGTSSARTRTE